MIRVSMCYKDFANLSRVDEVKVFTQILEETRVSLRGVACINHNPFLGVMKPNHINIASEETGLAWISSSNMRNKRSQNPIPKILHY